MTEQEFREYYHLGSTECYEYSHRLLYWPFKIKYCNIVKQDTYDGVFTSKVAEIVMYNISGLKRRMNIADLTYFYVPCRLYHPTIYRSNGDKSFVYKLQLLEPFNKFCKDGFIKCSFEYSAPLFKTYKECCNYCSCDDRGISESFDFFSRCYQCMLVIKLYQELLLETPCPEARIKIISMYQELINSRLNII